MGHWRWWIDDGTNPFEGGFSAHFPTDDTIALGSSRDLTITLNTLTGGTLTSLVLHDIAMPYDLFGVYVDNVAIRVRYISRKITCTIFSNDIMHHEVPHTLLVWMNIRREESYVGFGSGVSPGEHNILVSDWAG